MALNDYRKATPVSGKMADFSDAPKVNKSKFIASDSLNVAMLDVTLSPPDK